MITDQEFLRISSYMKRNYGIDLGQKKVIVNGRLENYIKKGGWHTFDEFMDEVEHDITGEKQRILVNFLTTNHTYFMREFEHFDFFRSTILPYLKHKEAAKKDLRIWCGAASSGEEPYMIAMTLIDFFGVEHNAWDTKVLATDISTKALAEATKGIYSEEDMKNIPEHWRRHFFKDLKNGSYQVSEQLRNEVIFRRMNLMDPFPFKKKMHTIFLRNVMIYFNEETKRDLVQRVYDALEPGGYLFIGTTETLNRASTPFQIIQPSIFRKKEG